MPSQNKRLASIRYKRNFLTEVIARVDFLNPIEGIDKRLPPKISRTAKRYFPIAEPQKTLTRAVELSSKSLVSKDTEITEWNFYGKDREKVFKITPSAVLVSYTAYKTYELLKEEFFSVLSTVFDTYPDLQGTRLGLRYINTIKIEGEPLNWANYLNPKMLCTFDFPTNKRALTRLLHLVEFNYGDFNLRYQFGMPNPDYPAQIRQKIFVLDFDAYYQGLLDQGDIPGNIDRFHAQIQELFELSIGNALRELMHVER